MSCNGCKAKDVGACTAHGGTGWDPRAGPHPCPEAVKIKRYGALDDSSYARVCPHCGKSEADVTTPSSSMRKPGYSGNPAQR